MKDIIENLLADSINKLKANGSLKIADNQQIRVDYVKQANHGDFASNVAMVISKSNALKPKEIAELICNNVPKHPAILKVEIAEPGFINFFINKETSTQIVKKILVQKEKFGSSNLGKGEKVIIEFVSSNPTGPLHVGHGRSAAFGASLANILATAGYSVYREYYVNDAGRQMNILAVSVWIRYLNLAGVAIIFPNNGYQGDYVFTIAQQIFDEYGLRFVKQSTEVLDSLPLDESQGGDKEKYIDALIERAKELIGHEGFNLFHKLSLDFVLKDLQDDLQQFGVEYDCWFSEQSLFDSGALDKGVQTLKDKGCTVVKDGALWFRATDFGDLKDRVLIRANGRPTYFSADVAYHWNKYERGFTRLINVLGADHHGYVDRIKAAVKALGHDERTLDVIIVQFAILYRDKKRLSMSTRSGTFVTLRQLRKEVGNAAARFFYVMRKPEQHMDFDLDLAKAESNDNPVYYIQYAHARICAVLRQLKERGYTINEANGLLALHKLTTPQELEIFTLLNKYPDLVNNAAKNCEPHQIAYYLRQLAHSLHSYYGAIIILCEDQELRNARLCLLKAVKQVLHNALALIGVAAPKRM